MKSARLLWREAVIFNDVPGSMLRDPAAAACLCKCRQQTVILARQVAEPAWGRGHFFPTRARPAAGQTIATR
jgi:hypothetical protein